MQKLQGNQADVSYYENLGEDHRPEIMRRNHHQRGTVQAHAGEDAISVLRLTMEKHQERQKGLHLVFIDLEKVYDRVPWQEVWRCMREKGVPEKYVRLVQDMYKGVKTLVRSSVGDTEKFTVKVGLHQGPVLSQYLFDLIMDVIAKEVKGPPPWSMMFTDGIALCCKEREEVENKTEDWCRVMEERGLRVSLKKTENMQFNDVEGGCKIVQREREREREREQALFSPP